MNDSVKTQRKLKIKDGKVGFKSLNDVVHIDDSSKSKVTGQASSDEVSETPEHEEWAVDMLE